MREQFIDKNFSTESQALIDRMNEIIKDYQAQGYDLSLRQLYYRLVAATYIENTERSYKRVGAILSDARLAGLVDWDAIVDRGREMISNTHWSSPQAIIDACAKWYEIDKWRLQPWYIEVMVEKQALEGVLEPVCRELDVPFTSNRGYSSSSAMYQAGQRIKERFFDQKNICIIYLGDHDPSGIDMSRDVEERLRLFIFGGDEELEELSEDELNEDDSEGQGFIVERIALNADQIQQYQPPPNPTKVTDSRAAGYIRQHGYNCWELDALEPEVLARLVKMAVLKHRDEELWRVSILAEESGRDALSRLKVGPQ